MLLNNHRVKLTLSLLLMSSALGSMELDRDLISSSTSTQSIQIVDVEKAISSLDTNILTEQKKKILGTLELNAVV